MKTPLDGTTPGIMRRLEQIYLPPRIIAFLQTRGHDAPLWCDGKQRHDLRRQLQSLVSEYCLLNWLFKCESGGINVLERIRSFI